MKILVVPPEGLPYASSATTPEDMQRIVGGRIEVRYPFHSRLIALVCNMEGKLRGLPLNRQTGGRWIRGTFFLIGAGKRGFVSLTDHQLDEFSVYYTLVDPPE